ncbi:MAG: DUF7657 domain-containing protein, partial [Acidimicrobiia bacterium]
MGEDKRGGRRLARWAVLVTAVTIVLAVGGPLVGRGVFIGVDIIRTFAPWNADTPTDFVYRHGPIDDTVNAGTPARVVIREGMAAHHDIPLWNPYPNGGTPLGSQPDTGLFSPLNWPELLLGVKLGAAWAALLRFAVAAIGAYYLLRHLGISRFAATCAGLIYCTNGFILFWTNWPQGDIAALLPALFVTADIVREQRRARDVALLAIVIASMLLEGYPPLVLASMYALAAFLVLRWWESSTPEPDADNRLSRSARMRRTASGLTGAITPAVLVIGGVVLGAAIAAFQLLPFISRLGVYDTSYRSLDEHIGFHAAALLTTMFPQALGDQAQVGREAFNNFVPTGRMLFLGAATVVLALWAVVRGRPEKVGRVTYRYWLAGAIVLLLVLIGNPQDAWAVVNRPMTTALYVLPGMDQVPLVRIVSLFSFFVTMLAAFGIEHVVRSPESLTARPTRRWRIRIAVVAAFVAGFAVLALDSEGRLFSRTITVGDRVVKVIGDRSSVLHNAIVPALIAIATALVIFVAWRWHGRTHWLAVGTIPVLLAIEALFVTTPLMPRAPNADFYPQTPALRYLARHAGHERFAAPGRMMFPSTNTYYRLRSVTGHSFSPPEWRNLVAASSPGTLSTPTQTLLGGGLGVATSPMLDQLSARFFVDAVEDTPFGHVEPAPSATSTATITRRAGATGPVGPGPL